MFVVQVNIFKFRSMYGQFALIKPNKNAEKQKIKE